MEYEFMTIRVIAILLLTSKTARQMYTLNYTTLIIIIIFAYNLIVFYEELLEVV